jgi:excinuclease ABC subunit C
MEIASGHLEFEEAARLRDLIAALRSLQARQYVDGHALDLDALACAIRGSAACVLLLAFRDGRNLGTRAFFPKTNGEENVGEVLSAFVSQYYAEHPIPSEILLSHEIPDVTLIEQALTESSGHKVALKSTLRGARAGYVDLAHRNAEMALVTELNSRSAQHARSEALRELLKLDGIPSRIECFDISHTMGEATVASCVVFNAEGAVRGQYRRYNITGTEPGDDYAAIRQAIERRFRRAVEARAAKEDAMTESARDNSRISRLEKESVLPDVLLIDGGVGQLAQAQAILAELGVDGIALVGVAKGEARRPGHETLIFPDGREISPGAASFALQFIQQVRDEAHRFAITGHRGQRQKARTTSRLEDIPGIGPRRRAALLKHFGGLAGLKAAGEEEIARVEGINAALAARIYANLHGLPLSSSNDKFQAPYR